MFKLAIKSLLGHKLRMLLTAFSIIIGVALVSGSYIFTDSMNSTFTTLFEDAYTGIDLTIRPVDEGPTTEYITPAELEQIKNVDGIEHIAPAAGGTAQLVNVEDGSLIGSPGAPTFGFSWTDIPELTALRIKDGNGSAPSAPGEIAIDVNSADLAGLGIGDKIGVAARGPVEEFTIVGLASFGDADTLAGATLALFTLPETQRLFELGNNYSEVSLARVEGRDLGELQAEVQAILRSDLEAVTGDQQKQESVDEINTGLGFITTALLSFAGVTVFVAAFIIQNTFRIIVNQRSKELALLRAIGATRGQVVRIVAYEAFIVSVLASFAGILAGVAVSSGIRAMSNAFGLGLPPGDLTLQPRTIYVSLMVGVVVTMVSALMPALKASKVSPVEALGDAETNKKHRSLKKRGVLGFVVAALGVSLMMYGLFAGDLDNRINPVGSGAFVVFMGVSVLAPILAAPAANLIGGLLSIRYGVMGKIATQNTKRSPRRTSSTASALMIGVALVVFVSIFASSIKATIDVLVAKNFPGDIVVTEKILQTEQVPDGYAKVIGDKLEALDEVGVVARSTYAYVDLAIDGSSFNETLIVAVQPENYNQAYNLGPVDGNYDKLTKNTIYVNEDFLESENNLSIGSYIDVIFAGNNEQSFEITGTFAEVNDSSFLFSKYDTNEYLGTDDDQFMVVNAAEGYTIDETVAAASVVLEDYPKLEATDKSTLISEVKTQIDGALGLMTALLAFAILIAVLGITNTLTLSVAERTREIGMLRAVGMTRRQVRQMIRVEAVIIAVFGALLGAVIGIFFGWAILKALAETGFTAFSIPTRQVITYILMSAFAGMIAAIGPSFKASRMKILDAINYQ